MPPVSKNQQTDLRVLPVVTATEPLEPRSLQLGLQSGTELENWICQKLVSSSGGTTTVQTMQLARQLSSDPVLLEKWVRALVEQGDPITIPERPIIRDPFNLSRRDPFAAVLERNGLGRSESESKLPSEIERLVSKARTEQLLEAGSRLPQTPEEAEAFFRSLPPEMQQQLLDTAAGEMTERTALRLQKLDSFKAFLKEQVAQSEDPTSWGRWLDQRMYRDEAFACRSLLSYMPKVEELVMEGATIKEALRDANRTSHGYEAYDLVLIHNAAWRADNLYADMMDDDVSNVTGTEMKVLTHMRELASYEHLEGRTFFDLQEAFRSGFHDTVTDERRAELHEEARSSIEDLVEEHVDSWRNPGEEERKRGAQPMTEEQIAAAKSALIEQKYELLEMREIAAHLDPSKFDPSDKQIWKLYNDVMDPQGQWLNLKDSTQDRIFEEVVINVPLLVVSGGAGNLARAGLTGLAREVAGELVVRGALKTGVEIAAEDTARIIGKKWFAETLARRLALGAPTLLTEGAVFETVNQGLHGQWIGNQENWVQQILWSSATLGAFHATGAAANRAFRFAQKDGGRVVYDQAGNELKELTRLGEYTAKIKNPQVRELAEQLILKGHATAASMLLTEAARQGIYEGNPTEVMNDLGGKIFHAYLSAGALTVTHTGIRTMRGKDIALPRANEAQVELQRALVEASSRNRTFIPLAEITVGDSQVRGRISGNGQAVYVEGLSDLRRLYQQAYGAAPGENVVAFWEPATATSPRGRLVSLALSPDANAQQRREFSGLLRHENSHLNGASEVDAYLDQAGFLAREGAAGRFRMIFENGTYRVERARAGEAVELPSRESIESFLRDRPTPYTLAAVERPIPKAHREGVLRDIAQAREALKIEQSIDALAPDTVTQNLERLLSDPKLRFDPAQRAELVRQADYLRSLSSSITEIREMNSTDVRKLPRLGRPTAGPSADTNPVFADWREACRRVGVDPAGFEWRKFQEYVRNAENLVAALPEGPERVARAESVRISADYLRQHQPTSDGRVPPIDSPSIRTLADLQGRSTRFPEWTQTLGLRATPNGAQAEFTLGELGYRRQIALLEARAGRGGRTEAQIEEAYTELKAHQSGAPAPAVEGQVASALRALGLSPNGLRPAAKSIVAAAEVRISEAKGDPALIVEAEASRDFLLQFAGKRSSRVPFPKRNPDGESLQTFESRRWEIQEKRVDALARLGLPHQESSINARQINEALSASLRLPGADRAALMARADFLRDRATGKAPAVLPNVAELEAAYRSKYEALRTLGVEVADATREPVYSRKELTRLYRHRLNEFSEGKVREITRPEIEAAYQYLVDSRRMSLAEACAVIGIKAKDVIAEDAYFEALKEIEKAEKSRDTARIAELKQAYRVVRESVGADSAPKEAEPIGAQRQREAETSSSWAQWKASIRARFEPVSRLWRETSPSVVTELPNLLKSELPLSKRAPLNASRQFFADVYRFARPNLPPFLRFDRDSFAWRTGPRSIKFDAKADRHDFQPKTGIPTYSERIEAQRAARATFGLDADAEIPSRRVLRNQGQQLQRANPHQEAEIGEAETVLSKSIATPEPTDLRKVGRSFANAGIRDWVNPWLMAGGVAWTAAYRQLLGRKEQVSVDEAFSYNRFNTGPLVLRAIHAIRGSGIVQAPSQSVDAVKDFMQVPQYPEGRDGPVVQPGWKPFEDRYEMYWDHEIEQTAPAPSAPEPFAPDESSYDQPSYPAPPEPSGPVESPADRFNSYTPRPAGTELEPDRRRTTADGIADIRLPERVQNTALNALTLPRTRRTT